jgi:hypothetical protein
MRRMPVGVQDPFDARGHLAEADERMGTRRLAPYRVQGDTGEAQRESNRGGKSYHSMFSKAVQRRSLRAID